MASLDSDSPLSGETRRRFGRASEQSPAYDPASESTGRSRSHGLLRRCSRASSRPEPSRPSPRTSPAPVPPPRAQSVSALLFHPIRLSRSRSDSAPLGYTPGLSLSSPDLQR